MKKLTLVSSLLGVSALTFACASPKTKAVSGPVQTLKCAPVTDAERPVLLWSTGGFSAPESVAYDAAKKIFYVSNVAGSPIGKDANGWISKMNSKGKITQAKWADGSRATVKSLNRKLNAPKGIALKDGVLWVADIDVVSAFSTKTGKKTADISIPEGRFLNDVAFDAKGNVLVSDMFTNRIYTINSGNEAQVLIEGHSLENPNGLVFDSGSVLISAWGNDIQPDFTTPIPGRVLSLDLETKKITPWSDLPLGNADGIAIIAKDTVVVSDWMSGKVYRVKKGGECTVLLEGFKGSADLTFIPETRTLVIPLMGEDRVAAYRLP